MDIQKKTTNKETTSMACSNLLRSYGISVDFFRRTSSLDPDTTYFLSHLHSDHTIGLTKRWNAGIIHVSKETDTLLRIQYPNAAFQTRKHPYYKWFTIAQGRACFLPANHCCGSVVIVLDIHDMLIVATGDYRGSQQLYEWAGWEEFKEQRRRIDWLLFDSSFYNPSLILPTMDESIEALSYVYKLKQQKRGKGAILMLLMNTIGAEVLLINWLRETRTRASIWVDETHKNKLITHCIPRAYKTIHKKYADIWIVSTKDKLLCRKPNTVCARISVTWFLCRSRTKDRTTYPPPKEDSIYRINYTTHASYRDTQKLIELLQPRCTSRCVPLIDTNHC
jgi:hypothetical protein